MTRSRAIRKRRKRTAPLDAVAVYEHVASAFRRPDPGTPPIVFMLDEAATLNDPAMGQHRAVVDAMIRDLLAAGRKN